MDKIKIRTEVLKPLLAYLRKQPYDEVWSHVELLLKDISTYQQESKDE